MRTIGCAWAATTFAIALLALTAFQPPLRAPRHAAGRSVRDALLGASAQADDPHAASIDVEGVSEPHDSLAEADPQGQNWVDEGSAKR